jgi:hypothetical protein
MAIVETTALPVEPTAYSWVPPETLAAGATWPRILYVVAKRLLLRIES